MLHKINRLKRKGFMMLSAILATLIMLMIAHGFMTMYGGQFTYLQAGKTASQGQQYAELVGEKVKLEGVDASDVTTKTDLSNLTGNDKDKGWQYTYEVSDGTEDENGNIFKVATIKIFKDGETSPRYTYEVPLSSLGSNIGEFKSTPRGYYWKLPNGLIYQWGDTENRGFQHWQKVDFPIEFPNGIISISAISKRNGVGAAGVNYRADFTRSYCYFMPQGEGQSDYSTHFYWTVVGH